MEETKHRIDNLKEIIRKTPVDVLQERIYICLANGCILLTSYKQENGKKGWSSKLHNDMNQPMLSSKDQEYIENTFSKAPWIMNVFNENLEESSPKKKQKGGSGSGSGSLPTDMPTLVSAGSQIIKPTSLPAVTPQDISLDATFEALMDKLNGIDDFWNNIAYESPGFLKKINNIDDINITTPLGTLPIPIPPFITMFMVLLDSLRFSLSLGGVKSNVLTIVIMLEELLTGQWRQMILTAVGFISPSGVAIGTVLKYIVNAMMLVSPEIRTDLFKDVIRSGKSAFIGFLLWGATVFPPKKYREELEELLTTLRKNIQGYDDKIKALQEQGSAALAAQGKKIDFTGLDLTNLRRISFQDIQNIQSLAQWDVLVCSLEFQEIVSTVETSPIFRIIMELLNVPTTPHDKYKKCGPPPYLPIQEKAKIATTPEIVDTLIPENLMAEEEQEEKPEVKEEGETKELKDDTTENNPTESDDKPVETTSSPPVSVSTPAPVDTAEPVVEATKDTPHINTPADTEEPSAPPSHALVPKSSTSKIKIGGGTKKNRKVLKLKKTKSIRQRKSTPRRVSRRL